MADARGGFGIGFAAALATAAIWASWHILTRVGAQSFDISVLLIVRYVLPTLVFVPVLVRIGLAPRSLSRGLLALVVLTGGVGFVALAALALRYAPAAEVAPLFPGTPPLFLALYALLWERERFGLLRGFGFVLLALGLAIIIVPPIWHAGELELGHGVALLAGLDWAVFTVVYRRSGLGAVDAAALISFWSTVAVLPFGLMPLIAAIEAQMYAGLVTQVVIQGIVSGLAATVLFGVAVNRLGGPTTTAVTALTPALSAMLAVLFLGEVPTSAVLAGITAIIAGVVFASWPKRAQLA